MRNINGTYKTKQNMQNGTISELYTDDKKSKYSSNPNDILVLARNFNEKLYTKETNVNTFQMNCSLTFINNILSNNAYVYQSWENLGTIGVSSRTGVISAIYKKSDKENFANYRPISLIFRSNNISISKY